MTGAAVDQPARCFKSEAAETAGNENGLIAGRGETAVQALLDLAFARRCDDDLADMSGLLHQTERVDDLAGFEFAVRQRRQRTFLKQPHNGAEQPPALCAVVQDQLIEIDTEIGKVATEWTQANMRIGD